MEPSAAYFVNSVQAGQAGLRTAERGER
jgi:hypothetical protein